MRLAIADPPYLGRAARWYGDGRGPGRGRVTAHGRNGRKPDHHPDAHEWDQPHRHTQLVSDLSDFDGWAIAGAPDYLGLLLAAAPADARVAVWHRPNAMPGGGRIITAWEPVLYRVPTGRRDRRTGHMIRDVLTHPVHRQGFLGSKPQAWTRWVLDLLGYQPGDHVLLTTWTNWGGYRAPALLRAPARVLDVVVLHNGCLAYTVRLDPVTPETTQLPLYLTGSDQLKIEPADDWSPTLF